jgi:superfamily II DNA or RNA helicase
MVDQPLNLDELGTVDLPVDLPAIFKERLIEVFKADTLAHYNKARKTDSTADRVDIILAHLSTRQEKIATMELPYLDAAVEKTLNYYSEVLALEKPDNIVDQLKTGRDFPDINQRINIQELKEKQRLLIADEMGLGKSASAILAKETLDLGLTLVLAPANVVATWQKYLSDQINIDGEAVGYFKSGEAPRVLIVESLESLAAINSIDFDYIIMSQERLNQDYSVVLADVPFEYLIVDEIHKLKNISSGKQAEVLLKLSKQLQDRDGHLALLSGTPVPNTVQDMAVLLKLLYPETFTDTPPAELKAQIIRGDLVQLRSLLSNRMQAKALRDSIDIPPVNEVVKTLTLSNAEKTMYEVLLEDDEVTSLQKIHLLRKFLLNPNSVRPSSPLPTTRLEALQNYVDEKFTTHDRVLLFINHYIEDLMTGDLALDKQLQLPTDVTVKKVFGGTSMEERKRIESELNNGEGKQLLLVSGQTADVGVDYTGAQALGFVNEPWTKYEKAQQLARVARPGLSQPLEATTFLIEGSIESAMNEYIERKYNAIQKLLKGVPVSQLEKQMLSHENNIEVDKEVMPMLAKTYLSQVQRLNRLFGAVRERTAKQVGDVLDTHGIEYANTYQNLRFRSYQANNARVAGTLLQQLASQYNQSPDGIQILDMASGAEMLRSNLPIKWQNSVISLDRNPHHFQNRKGQTVVGSFLELPLATESMDYVNFSLAWVETALKLSTNEYERLQVLIEAARILKIGGKFVISLSYSDDLRSKNDFERLAENLGLKIVSDFTDTASENGQYRAHFITLEKVTTTTHEKLEVLVKGIDSEALQSIKFKKEKSSLRKPKNIVHSFSFGGKNHKVVFNPVVNALAEQESDFLTTVKNLSKVHGGVSKIPSELLQDLGLGRFFNGSKYRVFKNLAENGILIQ